MQAGSSSPTTKPSRSPGQGTSSGYPGSVQYSPLGIVQILVDAGVERDVCLEWVSSWFADTLPRKKKRTAADSKGHLPSDLVVWKVWRKYAGGDVPLFKCHRPLTASPPIPLVLLHKPFMDFLEEATVGEPDDGDLKLAWDFWKAVHADEYVTNHNEAAAAIGERLIHLYLNRDDPVIASAVENVVGGVRTDVIHMKGAFYPVIDEFKSEAAAGEPAMQNMDYFRRLWTLVNEVFGKKYQPYSLLINVRGAFSVEVMAASFQDGEVWAETIASFHCYPTAAGPLEELVHSARIWRAVRLFASNYSAINYQPPVPWCLSSFSRVEQPDKRKLFFTYDDGTGTRKAAKLSSRYSEEAHAAWKTCAPALFRVEKLRKGWLVVHMEYLDPGVWKQAWEVVETASNKERLLDRLDQPLQDAVAVGHAAGFVHGDFRLCNLMLKGIGEVDKDGIYAGYEVRILDFDWSGRECEAKYPAPLSDSVKWHKHAGFGKPIYKEHDSWFLTREGLWSQLSCGPVAAAETK